MASPAPSQSVPLYGGAMTVSLPSGFISADALRQIPDHQEVFITDPWSSGQPSSTPLGSHASIVFEVLSRAEPPDHPECTTDDAALRYHYEDLTETGHVRAGQEVEEDSRIWRVNTAIVDSLGMGTPAYVMLGTQTPREAGVINGVVTDFTAIWMLLIRLEAQKTDVLVSVNLPHTHGRDGWRRDDSTVDLEKGREGAMIKAGEEAMRSILRTFKVVDWDLFANEE